MGTPLRAFAALLTLMGFATAPAGALAEAPAADPISYLSRVVGINQVGLTITNYGVIGNNFTSRSPSLEYPMGMGLEHLTKGGLWFGARAVDDAGAFVGVTTGALEGPIGSAAPPGSEFTPAGAVIALRSTLPSSAHYHPQAVSHLDHLFAFGDQPARAGSGSWPESHRPLNILVRGSVFAWAFVSLQDALVLRFTIVNLGPPLTDAWAGLWTELASGPKNAYATWPPSSAGSTIGGWFSKKWLQYDPALRLLREHYCAGLPVPDACILDRAPAWMGVQLLGTAPDPIAGKRVTLAAWRWSPGNAARDQDVERHAIMSAGTLADLTHPDLMPQSGDPVELLAVGPFAHIATGDSVTVDFALVGGAGVTDIQAQAIAAQQFYDAGFALPTPTQLALASAEADADEVRLMWHGAEAGAPADVERYDEAADWGTLARVSADGEGRISYADREVLPGARYGYRVRADGNAFGEAWVDVPAGVEFRLEGARPNPASDGLKVAFSLPDAAPARIEVLDLAGRRWADREVGGLGGGRHVVDLAAGRAFPAGVYLVRLTRAGRALTARAVVVR